MSNKEKFESFILDCIERAVKEFGPEVKVSISIKLGRESANGLNYAMKNVDDIAYATAFVTRQCVKNVCSILVAAGLEEADAIEKTADLMQLTAENAKRILEAVIAEK